MADDAVALPAVPRRWAGRAVPASLAALAVLLAGCGPTDSRTIGIGASDVERVEVYQYAYSDEPTIVLRSEIVDRAEIEELIASFTDIPTEEFDGNTLGVIGNRAAGLRFFLRDGDSVELTQIYLPEGDGASIVLLPDGEVVHSDWGYPIGDYGTPSDPDANEIVDADQRPTARLGP